MMSVTLNLLLIAALLGVSQCFVEFTNSVLYDEYDIWQPTTTSFPRDKICKSGCSVYASIPDNESARQASKNVFITDSSLAGGTEKTLFEVAGLYDATTSQKKSLDFPAGAKVQISYRGKDAAGPVLVYVVAATPGLKLEVYEARTMNRVAEKADMITILSPEPFTVGAQPTQGGMSVSAHLGGWDSKIGLGGEDQCVEVFEMTTPSDFPGFLLNVQSPMLTFYFNSNTPISLTTQMEYSAVTTFGQNQFVASPGFTGCYGMDVYRSSLYKDFVDHTITADVMKHIAVDATLNTGEDHSVLLENLSNNQKISLWGDNGSNNAQKLVIMDSKLLHIGWTKAHARSGFLLRFTVSDYIKSSTTSVFDATTSSTMGVSLVVSSSIVLLLLSIFG